MLSPIARRDSKCLVSVIDEVRSPQDTGQKGRYGLCKEVGLSIAHDPKPSLMRSCWYWYQCIISDGAGNQDLLPHPQGDYSTMKYPSTYQHDGKGWCCTVEDSPGLLYCEQEG